MVGNNLLNFLCTRFANSWIILTCEKITGKQSPISVTTDVAGVAIANNIFTLQPNTSPTQSPTTTQLSTQLPPNLCPKIIKNLSVPIDININIIFLIYFIIYLIII